MPVEAFPNTPNSDERLESSKHLDGLNTARRFRGRGSASSLLSFAKTLSGANVFAISDIRCAVPDAQEE
jgi:hypothetical protein